MAGCKAPGVLRPAGGAGPHQGCHSKKNSSACRFSQWGRWVSCATLGRRIWLLAIRAPSPVRVRLYNCTSQRCPASLLPQHRHLTPSRHATCSGVANEKKGQSSEQRRGAGAARRCGRRCRWRWPGRAQWRRGAGLPPTHLHSQNYCSECKSGTEQASGLLPGTEQACRSPQWPGDRPAPALQPLWQGFGVRTCMSSLIKMLPCRVRQLRRASLLAGCAARPGGGPPSGPGPGGRAGGQRAAGPKGRHADAGAAHTSFCKGRNGTRARFAFAAVVPGIGCSTRCSLDPPARFSPNFNCTSPVV